MHSLVARIKNSRFFLLAMIVLIIITAAIETDIFIPAFPAMREHFATTEFMIQLLVGINFLGLCISSLVYGPLADAYGRKPILLLGSLIFLVASMGCLFVNTIEGLLFWRFVQGLGTGAAFVVPGAIIYDLYQKEAAAKITGIFNCVITLSMAGAPILGCFLSSNWGWQANLIVLCVLALLCSLLVIIGLPETHAPQQRALFQANKIITHYQQLITHPKAIGLLIIICCMGAAYMVYVSNLSLIFIESLGVDKVYYGYYQGAVLLAFSLLSMGCGKVIDYLGMAATRQLGLLLAISGASLFLIVGFLAPFSPVWITFSMALYNSGIALLCTIVYAEYMDLFPEVKGVACALAAAAKLLFTGMMIAVSGWLFTGSILPVAMMVFVLCGITFSTQQLLFWMGKKAGIVEAL